MIGETLGHYGVIEKIGSGGMGEVYRAHDEQLDRDVALKVLPTGSLADEAKRKLFRKEALVLAKLNHPNIATVHEFNRQGGGDFLAMELIRGRSLREVLKEGPLPEKEIQRLGLQLSEALAVAHEHGVVHCDLKPANIMITPDGRLKILDFGLAKLVQAPSADVTQSSTTAQSVPGTLPYMAPEQLLGEGADTRADVYAAGAVLYEMATGRRAFPESNVPRLIDSVLHKHPPLPREVNAQISKEMQTAILKAMQKNPDERQQSARELLLDLEKLNKVAPNTPSDALEQSNAPPLEIAHVLFMDIVAYSKMAMDEQRHRLRELQQTVMITSEFIRAKSVDQLISLPTGDGMALVFFEDPEAPVRCAVELCRALRSKAEIKLRMGIHTGPVYRVADINANRNVAGGGINIAQRVMDCGDAGHILGSGTVAEVLSQVSTWNTTLHDLGEVEVKHGLRIHVYNLYTDEVGNKETPKKVSAPGIPVLPPAVPPAPQVQPAPVPLPVVASSGSSKRGLYMGLGALVVVGVLFAAGFYLPRRLKAHAGEGQAAFPAKPSATGQATSQPAGSPATPAAVAAPGGVTAQSSQTSAAEKTGQPAADASSGTTASHADTAGNIKHSSQGAPASAEQRRVAAERAQAQAEAAAAEAARAKAAAEDLKEAEAQEDQLNGRAASVSQSLDNLKGQQSAQGYGLRGDVVSAEQRMQSYLSKAQAALQRQDGPSAKKFFEQADKEISFLEKFLGH